MAAQDKENMNIPIQRYPPSGLSILIVGGGLAGLAFAIEAFRKGHDVRIIERRPDFQDFGDLIVVQACALQTPRKWPGFMDRLASSAYEPFVHMTKYDGSLIGKFPFGNGLDDPSLPVNRSEFHAMLYEYAQGLGISIRFNATVVEYYESEGHAGVILSNGQKEEADVVVAADGVGSKAWRLILGTKDEPISSGFALYRVTFPAGPALENPTIAKEFEGTKDKISLYLGPGAHVVVGKTEKQICWVLTHRDDGNAREDWTTTASSDKALKYVNGWTPFLTELINATPHHIVTDWKLMWRNPQQKWVSPHGRVVQIGDAAHPFLPTSASGASMALEDAYSLATCLQLSGKSNASLALRVHNHFRFGRVSCAQKIGFKTREVFHNTDWDKVSKDPSIVGKPLGSWILQHDPEKYAYENYEKCANHILTGAPFENTNSVPGYKFKPWTVKELLDASERGVPVADEGDWYQ